MARARAHLAALSVFQWVLTFLFFGIFFTGLLIYLLFTAYWSVSALYFAWWILDWETPERGGRRCDWMRRWWLWQLHRDYFPIKLVKTAELPPTRNYVLGSHPHGIICAGAFSAFCTEATGFSQDFPGLQPSLCLLSGLFRVPVYREYMMSSGMVPVSKRSLDFLLRGGPGNAAVIVVGGAAESLDCSPGEQRVRLQGRRGFVRLALRHGYGTGTGGRRARAALANGGAPARPDRPLAPQGRPGAGVLLRRDRHLPAAAVRRGQLRPPPPGGLQAARRLRALRLLRPGPLLPRLLGPPALRRPHHRRGGRAHPGAAPPGAHGGGRRALPRALRRRPPRPLRGPQGPLRPGPLAAAPRRLARHPESRPGPARKVGAPLRAGARGASRGSPAPSCRRVGAGSRRQRAPQRPLLAARRLSKGTAPTADGEKGLAAQALQGFEPRVSCLLDRHFSQLSHGSSPRGRGASATVGGGLPGVPRWGLNAVSQRDERELRVPPKRTAGLGQNQTSQARAPQKRRS